MKRDDIVDHLTQSILFKDATAAEIISFAQVARVLTLTEGAYVYQKGDPSEIFYVIAVGEVELFLDNDTGSTKIVGRIGPGGHFGETGILTNKQRSLGVRAISDLVMICFDKRFFRTSFLTNHRIHKQLDSALAERLRVAFQDQIDAIRPKGKDETDSEADDVILFKDKNLSAIQLRRIARNRKNDIRESKTAQKTQAVIDQFAANSNPYLLTGESGTGKSIIARQVHSESSRSSNHYLEIDLREYEPMVLERQLFGLEQSNFPFANVRQAGFFEQTSGGTVVFTHAHLMGEELQQELVNIIKSSIYCHIGSKTQLAMQSRIVLITIYSFDHLVSTGKMIPELLDLVAQQYFEVPPLRNHKEDLPRLVSHYLLRFSKEYGKKIHTVTPETLGIFMNYDWPGNLTELSSVIRRAVMLAKKDEIDSEQILLGLPKTEGKWEYNLLRIHWVRKLLSSWLFPRVPQVIIGCVLLIAVAFLFFGPSDPAANIGLTIGWYIGWPLMFFSFFFLARTWCSVCSFAVPGTLLQNIIKPTRNIPPILKNNAGWIMAVLCILVFWVEIVWDAYNNRYLTGGIILIITLGSILFSVLFSRRAWCRYFCPLGAVNAIFSMPSIVELRSNSHVCLNRCQSHACFHGDSEIPGCPMFRHPFLVDNNRDCIMCAKCIKACDNSSIQLNVRLAPQELWALETPRRADSFLIVSMGAIFFPFALQDQFRVFVAWCVEMLNSMYGLSLPSWVVASVLFFSLIFVFQIGYYLMITAQSMYAQIDRAFLLPLLGYGFIPLILGGYMALHLEFFVSGAGRILPNIQEIFGFAHSYENIRLISSDSTYVLQFLTLLGGLLASLYATYRVTERVLVDVAVTSKTLAIPFSFLICLATLFVFMV
ncbi:sigma 54-interacting transcriptional regulator [Desulforhopalus sp. IMCC35007]|uniref:sigma 54-interacting transcriptional regulator n=1 Tax=Desulforhopalus sp. IMCC35007 TaxID=2569543 RepID=UPI0010AEBA70|nr:sigma 54-interacting transcriptional regulator [Desulforhopalus sp. IMCC35007]TKB10713.1 cyclic nucleotide-binding domain-containing protein [Desulforhopalus sp. IMCC35007]